jgi:hypothetical protein
MWKYLKKNYIVLIMIAALLALGTFFIVLPGIDFILVFSILLGVYLAGAAVYIFLLALRAYALPGPKSARVVAFIASGALLGLAVLTVIYPAVMVRIVIFLIFIVTPTVALFVKPDKKAYLRKNFWKYILGVILLLSVEVLVDIAFIIVGVLFYGVAGYLIYLLVIHSRMPEKPNLFDKYLVRYIISISKNKK